MGACMMLRRPFPRFDEDYFLYCEDTDLCYRVRQAGGKIYYVHDAVFVHHLGASGEPQRAQMVIYYNRGKERYFRKFHGAWQARVCRWLSKGGALLRVLVGLAGVALTLGRHAGFRRYAATFLQVWREIPK
jgi:GT2 family glycosyltransferase